MDIMEGDFVGLLGPSGSGKTTLLRTILGAVDIFQGEVEVEGVPTSQKKPKVGYVPQLETIDWNFPVTVQEVVLMGRAMDNRLFPWYRREDRMLAAEMMERLGISDLAKRHIRELSGGQQQRVFLARALVGSRRILLLDEPTSGVDIKTRDDVMHVLHELNHQGITIIMTTHEINAVAVHLPWIVCMNGRVLAEGPPAEVITSETLMLTYGADMPVIHYQGMTLVAESPHAYGRKVEEPDPQLEPVQINGTGRKTEVGHGHGHPHDHEHDQLADLDQPSVAPVSADADADAGEPVPAPDTEQEIKYV
jgi:zinc/manganese transport system ATP-binding protein/zinc transport system ATP-binding protein